MKESITIYQDDQGYKAIGNISRNTLFESENAHIIIQQAVDEYGGEVILEPGDFVLKKPVRLADNVTLRGRGRATRLVVEGDVGLLGEGANGAGVVDMRLVAEDGAGSGIVLDDCGDCKVRDVLCAGFAEYGIWVRNNSFLCEIRGCSLAGNQKANIFLDHLACGQDESGHAIMTRAGTFIPNLVTNCTIFGGGKGIETQRTIVANIVACVVYQTNDIGFHIHTRSNSVLISGCRTFQITGSAVVVEDTHEFNLSSNIFCWHTQHGIIIKSARWGAIVGNEVIDTGSWNSGLRIVNTTPYDRLPADFKPFNGIHMLDVHGYSVTGNTIFNWPVCPPMRYGIYEDADSFKNIIEGNNINFYEGADVLSQGRETVVGDNVGYGEEPHTGARPPATNLQSYDPGLTAAFVDLLKA